MGGFEWSAGCRSSVASMTSVVKDVEAAIENIKAGGNGKGQRKRQKKSAAGGATATAASGAPAEVVDLC